MASYFRCAHEGRAPASRPNLSPPTCSCHWQGRRAHDSERCVESEVFFCGSAGTAAEGADRLPDSALHLCLAIPRKQRSKPSPVVANAGNSAAADVIAEDVFKNNLKVIHVVVPRCSGRARSAEKIPGLSARPRVPPPGRREAGESNFNIARTPARNGERTLPSRSTCSPCTFMFMPTMLITLEDMVIPGNYAFAMRLCRRRMKAPEQAFRNGRLAKANQRDRSGHRQSAAEPAVEEAGQATGRKMIAKASRRFRAPEAAACRSHFSPPERGPQLQNLRLEAIDLPPPEVGYFEHMAI